MPCPGGLALPGSSFGPQKRHDDQDKGSGSDILGARSIKGLRFFSLALVRHDKRPNTEGRRAQKQPKEDKGSPANCGIRRRQKRRTGEESNPEAEQRRSTGTSFCEGHELQIFALITNSHLLVSNVSGEAAVSRRLNRLVRLVLSTWDSLELQSDRIEDFQNSGELGVSLSG